MNDMQLKAIEERRMASCSPSARRSIECQAEPLLKGERESSAPRATTLERNKGNDGDPENQSTREATEATASESSAAAEVRHLFLCALSPKQNQERLFNCWFGGTGCAEGQRDRIKAKGAEDSAEGCKEPSRAGGDGGLAQREGPA